MDIEIADVIICRSFFDFRKLLLPLLLTAVRLVEGKAHDVKRSSLKAGSWGPYFSFRFSPSPPVIVVTRPLEKKYQIFGLLS